MGLLNATRITSQKLLGDQLAARILGPGLVALLIKVASAALSYAMFVVFARMLSAEDFGHFGQMLNLAIVVAAVASFGLPTAILRFWPGHVAKGELALAKGFARDAQRLLLGVVSGLVGVGLVAGFANFPPDQFGWRWGVPAVAVLGGMFAIGDYYAAALRAQGLTTWSLLPRDVVWRFAAPFLAAVWLWWDGGLSAGAALVVCIGAMAIVAGAQALRSGRAAKLVTGRVIAQTDWTAWRPSLLPLAGAGLLYAMVQQLDVVVVGALVGPQEAGAYFAAQKTASLLGLAMIAGGLVAAPLMSAAFQSGKREELQRLCRLLGIAIAATTLLGFLVLVLLGSQLLSIFDPAYAVAYPILIILALGFAVDAMAGPSAYLMQMTSLEGPYLRVMAVVYVFVLALQFMFVPRYGVLAAAVASAAGVCLWNVIAVRLLRQKIGVDPSLLAFVFPPKAPS